VPPDAPLDDPEAPPDVPAEAPVPVVPVVPVVPAPVVPPPVPLPLSLLPPPAFERARAGTVVLPELMLLGLLLRTQSARAVPVIPAHDALGVVVRLLRRQSESAVPVMPVQALVVSCELVPVALDVDDDVVPRGIDDVPDVDVWASAAPVAASDVARMSVFNFHNFIASLRRA